ncbi:MAG: GDSL-type esterase/lipase family protein [Candidatus Saccharimonadales bacterium]
MKRLGGGLISLFFILSLGIAAFVYVYVSGAIADVWISTQLQNETVASNIGEESARQYAYCNKTEVPAYSWKDSKIISSDKKVSACWHTTSNNTVEGLTSQGKYIRTSAYGPLALVGASSDYRLAGSKVVSKLSSSTVVYDEPESTKSIKAFSGIVYYMLDQAAGSRWTIEYASASVDNINFRYFTMSQNGNWLVGRASNGFVRVNLSTKEVLSFDTYKMDYGYGVDPQYDMAISDDGRHVAINEANVYDYTLTIYDLSTCASQTTMNRTIAAGCQKRDIKSQVASNTTYRPVNLYFNTTGNMLLYSQMTSPIQWARKAIMSGMENRYDYIAMGDSYSSGEGAFNGVLVYRRGTDRDGERYPESNTGITNYPYNKEVCHQSLVSYPYLLSDYGMIQKMGDVACTGAKIKDISNINDSGSNPNFGSYSQLSFLSKDPTMIRTIKNKAIDNLFPGRAAQIEMISKYQPHVVTIGIGGNDVDFGGKLTNCVEIATSTCSFAADLRHFSGLEIRAMHQKYLSLFRQLKIASPATRFYAVGYPQFLSYDSISSLEICALNVSLDVNERKYIMASVQYLNQIIKSAAEQSGVTYLDVETSLQGKALCDNNLPGDKAVNGIDNGNDQYGMIGNESFHPTDIGHKMMFDSIEATLSNKTILSFDPCVDAATTLCATNPTAAIPTIPNYFSDNNAKYEQVVATSASNFVVSVPSHLSNGVQKTYNMVVDTTHDVAYSAGEGIAKADETLKFAPYSSVLMIAYSEPRDLGTVITDSNGNVKTTVSLPADLPYGTHTIVLLGKNVFGEEIALYQNIYVYATEEDIDGDGIPNTQEKCLIVQPANIDSDRDGIDDACDRIYNLAPDTVAPIVTGTTDRDADRNGWYVRDTTIFWQATDDRTANMPQPVATTASIEGQHIYMSEEVADEAGNRVHGEMSLQIDKTAPTVSDISWTINPKKTTDTSEMSVDVFDATSGIDRVEYYIGDNDPGRGNGAQMLYANGKATVSQTTDYPTGVYKMTVRAQDIAGNWSTSSSGYLVVYDPTSGVKARGMRTVMMTPGYTTNMPWLVSPTPGRFGFSVRYNADGSIAKQSDLQFAYKTGENCNRPTVAVNCHSFELNASSIAWLTTSGANNSAVMFQSSAVMKRDGIAQTVTVLVEASDGGRIDTSRNDTFRMAIYLSTIPFGAPDYYVGPLTIDRGNIKITY